MLDKVWINVLCMFYSLPVDTRKCQPGDWWLTSALNLDKIVVITVCIYKACVLSFLLIYTILYTFHLCFYDPAPYVYIVIIYMLFYNMYVLYLSISKCSVIFNNFRNCLIPILIFLLEFCSMINLYMLLGAKCINNMWFGMIQATTVLFYSQCFSVW